MRFLRPSLVALFLAAVGQAQAIDLKGLSPGVTLDCAALAAGGTVLGGPCGEGDPNIVQWETSLAGAPAVLKIKLEPAEADGTRRIHRIESDRLAALMVESALTAKYGKPVSNAPAKITMETWTDGDITLRLIYRGADSAHLWLYRMSDAKAEAAEMQRKVNADL